MMNLSYEQFQRIIEHRDVHEADLIHKGIGRHRGSVVPLASPAAHHDVRSVELPTRAVGITLTTLDPCKSTVRRRCTQESIIFVMRGGGRSVIGQSQVKWQTGDAVYIPAWTWHQHFNENEEEDTQFLTCDNSPMLRTLGIPPREEY